MKDFNFDSCLVQKLDEILEKNDMSKFNLIAILLEVQSIIPNNYIPEEVASYISDKLNVPLSKVYDVISFYAALSDKPMGRYVIQICKSTCCKINKYEKILETLENELGIKCGETTSDGRFTLEYSSCFGACDISPAIRINHRIYGNLDESKVKEIINYYKEV